MTDSVGLVNAVLLELQLKTIDSFEVVARTVEKLAWMKIGTKVWFYVTGECLNPFVRETKTDIATERYTRPRNGTQ